MEKMDGPLPEGTSVSGRTVTKRALFRLVIDCLEVLKSYIALAALLLILFESLRQGGDLHAVKGGFERFLGLNGMMNHTKD